MSELYRTLAEIRAAYPNEWVLMDRPKSDRHQNLKGGYVVCHSPNRDNVEEAALRLPRPFHVAIVYTGAEVDDGSI